MPPHRNMGWRKPVPKFIPETPCSLSRFSSTSFKRLSFSHLDKEVPPLPDDWLLKLGGSLSKAKRQGFVLDDQIDPRWIEQYRSHPVSFPTVEEQTSEQDLRSLFSMSSTQGRSETTHTMPRRMRHKRSLPQHYRPPTPPLKREHPERRPRSGYRMAQQTKQPLPHDNHDVLSLQIENYVQSTASPTPMIQILPSVGTAKQFRVMHTRSRHGPAGASRASSLHSRTMSSTSSALRAKRHGQGIVTIWADVKTLGIQVRLRFHHLFR
ncbi:uncharacterized protein C8Q71DRAFT_37711 [Rhodofomes roseus]|uniref:Uncharacterized protein n=1 Tax=Rhodofomes roseus TaxID=34475 RepID=A0ABQ8L0S5_9APHY|nr:uncharacterized protein C8Q71DRAFT_37711 [Rhodofomes roseus]KAH9844265.1 hypothetical protein C8Q71DRAFT_37711 [Rhodofomes roseus]